MRKCPYPNCGKRIDPAFFMCPPHWRSLTPGQQSRVSEAYQRYRSAQKSESPQAVQMQALEKLQAAQNAVLGEVGHA